MLYVRTIQAAVPARPASAAGPVLVILSEKVRSSMADQTHRLGTAVTASRMRFFTGCPVSGLLLRGLRSFRDIPLPFCGARAHVARR